MRSVVVAVACVIFAVSCGPPPPPPPKTAQELLVARVKPMPVEGASGLAEGRTVRIGGMTLAIDRSIAPRNLAITRARRSRRR